MQDDMILSPTGDFQVESLRANPAIWRDLVLKIHQTPHKAVLAITGGGAEAIGELLRHGQGSSTLLEAVVPYDQASFDDFVKGKPDKYCSPEAACDLAMASYQRAIKLCKGKKPDLVGIGVTCSLMKDEERAGREHHAFIAVQTETTTYSYTYNTEDLKKGRRDAQESFVAQKIIEALADACGVQKMPAPIRGDIVEGAAEEQKVVNGEAKFMTFNLVGAEYTSEPMTDRYIFPGSFNPWHEGHERMVEKVFQLTGKPVDLEITVRNVDKPAINYISLNRRLFGCREAMKNKPWQSVVHLTALPTFAEKVQAFPNSTWIIGWDTFKRINDPKYGNLDKVVEMFVKYQAKFMVFHRIMDGVDSSKEKFDFHPAILNMARILGPDMFPPLDFSSSRIRKGQ